VALERPEKEEKRQQQGLVDSTAGEVSTGGEPCQTEGDEELMAAFKAASEAAAELTMSTEEIIEKRLDAWMQEWGKELGRRAPEDRLTAAGKQAEVRYKETREYLRPLFSRLQKKTIDAELLAGLKLITDAMKDRNYLHAYKLYMAVAIGNSPWPIGVTHVGLHERANRERIGFKKNSQGNAHIMNDEASRKYIQALKRLMTFVQRRYPTDPSRCMDFDANNALGDGQTNKLLLLEAEAKGDLVTDRARIQALPQSVERWDNIVNAQLRREDARRQT
jgi:pre-mRNA-splicing factor 18